MINLRLLLFLCFLPCFNIQQAFSQKVALVLSGGGSKGIAHLGVIKALEENNIPIDYIVGTSMGGVVGGFYAAGYSVEEMEKILLSDDLQNWISGRTDEKYRYYLYKRESNASLLSLKISLDSLFKVTLKNTLIKDNSLNFALAELLSPASAASNCNFDSLFIPFRCLAADIFTQEIVLLKDGNLSDAVRATLSVPLFFKPIKVQNKYLFDGGLYDNFPVNVTREEFKPDIVIGVNVSSKTYREYPKEEDEILIRDALFYMFLSNSDSSQLDDGGIYIEPKLGNYSAVDFSEVKKFLDIGYKEAMLKMDSIKAKIQRRVDTASLNQSRRLFKMKRPEYRFGDVEISGLKLSQKRYVNNMFPYKTDKLNLEIIKKRYFRLSEKENFEVLYPNFFYNESKKTYDFNLIARPDQSIRADIGGNLASRNISTLYMGLEYDYVRTLLYTFSGNFYFGRFYSSTDVHVRINIPTRNPIYLEPNFVYNEWNFLNANELFFNKEQTILLQNDTYFGFNMGMAAGRRNKLIFKFNIFRNNDRYSNTSSISTNGELDLTRFEGETFGFEFSQDDRNRKQFASKGSSFIISAKYVIGKEDHSPGSSSVFNTEYSSYHEWLTLKLNTEKYFNLRRYSFGVFLEGVFSTQPVFRNYTSTLINAPAFYPLLDSRTLFLTEFRGFTYLTLGIKNILNLTTNIDLQTAFYVFNTYEPIKETDNQEAMIAIGEFDFLRLAATTSLVYHSRLGPISASVNYYNNERNKLGFLLNIGYLLFNKRPLD